jgi:hypothetical protein
MKRVILGEDALAARRAHDAGAGALDQAADPAGGVAGAEAEPDRSGRPAVSSAAWAAIVAAGAHRRHQRAAIGRHSRRRARRVLHVDRQGRWATKPPGRRPAGELGDDGASWAGCSRVVA